MALTGLSLNAVTATGPGVAITLDVPSTIAGMYVTTTGAPTSYDVALEGTMDGVNWYSVYDAGAQPSQPLIVSTVMGGSRYPSVAFRANLTSLTGGTSPTVSAFVVVVPAS